MYQITQITSDPFQQQTLVLPDGSQIGLTLQYSPVGQIWNITSLTYGSSFVLNGLQIVNNPNLLQQFKNQVPFGLACFASGSREPTQIQDFASGYASLYVLTAAEVSEYAAALQNGIASAE